MPALTFTIKKKTDYDNMIQAHASVYGYQETVWIQDKEGQSKKVENPESREEFVHRFLSKAMIDVTKNYLRGKVMEEMPQDNSVIEIT